MVRASTSGGHFELLGLTQGAYDVWVDSHYPQPAGWQAPSGQPCTHVPMVAPGASIEANVMVEPTGELIIAAWHSHDRCVSMLHFL